LGEGGSLRRRQAECWEKSKVMKVGDGGVLTYNRPGSIPGKFLVRGDHLGKKEGFELDISEKGGMVSDILSW